MTTGSSRFFTSTTGQYHPRYSAVIQRAIALGYALPSKRCMYFQNIFMIALINNGLLVKLDRLFVFANDVTSLFGTIDWVNPSNQCTPINSPTLTLKKGYESNGTTSYIQSGFSPSTQGVNYTLNSCCVGGYIKDAALIAAGVSSVICGLNAGSNHIFLGKNGNNASRLGGRLNSGPSPDVTFDILTDYEADTNYATIRVDSTTFRAVKNGVVLATNTTSSTAIPTGEMDILSRNASGTHNLFLGVGNILSTFFAGAGDLNQLEMSTRTQNYMTQLATV